MDFLLSRYRNLTVLLLVILAQLVLLAYQVKSNQDVRLIRVWTVTAVTPLAKVLEIVRANTIGVAENYFVLVNVRNENQRLKEELGRMKMANQFLRTELQTADRARALQAFQARTPSRTIPARIIGTGTGANSRVVFVDQGSNQGVLRGMAVVTPDGIVGKVLSSYPTASQVLLITDPTFAAGVMSEKNRVHGTLKGIGQNKCIVDYVQNEEKVDPGETFYTSGDDRIFPKGMPAGKVSVVRAGKTFKEIFVVPSGFQQGLEEVLIVVEGVHQAIPVAPTATAASGVYVMPAPEEPKAPATNPAAGGQQPAAAAPAGGAAAIGSALSTDADRLRDRYRQLGETQKHTYGEGFTPIRTPAPAGAGAPKPNVNPPAAGGGAVPPASGQSLAGSGTGPANAQPAGAANGTARTNPATAGPAAGQPGTPAPRTASDNQVTPATPAPGRTTVAKPPVTVNPVQVQPRSVPQTSRPANGAAARPAEPPPQR